MSATLKKLSKKIHNPEHQKKTLKFLAILTALGALTAIIAPALSKGPAQEITATHTAALLNTLGTHTVQHGTILIIGTTTAQVIPECVGAYSLLAVIALIIATPERSIKQKLTGALIAVPALHSINTARLATSFYTAHIAGISTYNFVHDWLWNSTLTISALALWAIWLHYTNKPPRKPI